MSKKPCKTQLNSMLSMFWVSMYYYVYIYTTLYRVDILLYTYALSSCYSHRNPGPVIISVFICLSGIQSWVAPFARTLICSLARLLTSSRYLMLFVFGILRVILRKLFYQYTHIYKWAQCEEYALVKLLLLLLLVITYTHPHIYVDSSIHTPVKHRT